MSETVKNKTRKKNAATQTSSTDTMLEIARLQEQVKLLTIENEHLRKYTNDEPSSSSKSITPVASPINADETPGRTRSAQKTLQTPNTQKKSNKMSTRGCTCKGTCSSKMCGCVKKDVICGELCKCNSSVCKNQVQENMDQNKENLENIELPNSRVKNKQTENKHLANATASKSIFSPDVAKNDADFNAEQLRASSLYFGSPKQLTFESDKEEEDEKGKRTKNKTNKKKAIKNDKNEEKGTSKKRGRPKKVSSESNGSKQMQKVGGTSSEEEIGRGDKKTKNRTRKRQDSSDSDAQLNEKLKEIDKRANNYMKNIANGMVSLRRGHRGVEQAATNDIKRNDIISDSDSHEEASLIAEKGDPQDGVHNYSKLFQETKSEETLTFDQNQTPIIDEGSNNDFNPMKPKHELSRTPVHGSPRDNSDISVSMCVTLTEEERQIPEEFSQAEVDWEEYQSQLVACAKCNRKFHPLRIKKHESCCIKV